MNFIEHFRNWVGHAESDTRLKSHHVSLYIALFRYWNENRFRHPFTIFRHEIMAVSKIGSVNTYTKGLKELTEWNYIRYEPSFNPQVGSRVHLYRFDKGGDKGFGKGSDQATGKADSKARATYTINIPNSLNTKNNLNAYGTSHDASAFVDDETATPLDEIHSSNDQQKNPTGGGRAAARNWVINAKRFTNEHTSQPKPGRLNTGPKNYAEPL